MFNFIYDKQRRDYYAEENPTIRATRIDEPGYIYAGGDGGSSTTVEYPQPAPQPSTAEAIREWVSAMPTVFAEQMRQAPLQAQQQVSLAQQYAQPLGQAYQQAQQAMYPNVSALTETLAGQAMQGATATELPDWMRQQYLSGVRAQLGEQAASPIGADYISRGLMQQQQDWQNYYRNLGLSLSGRQPLAQPTMPQYGQYSQQFQPQGVMDFMNQGYGMYQQAARPFVVGGSGTSLGFLGQWGGY